MTLAADAPHARSEPSDREAGVPTDEPASITKPTPIARPARNAF